MIPAAPCTVIIKTLIGLETPTVASRLYTKKIGSPHSLCVKFTLQSNSTLLKDFFIQTHSAFHCRPVTVYSVYTAVQGLKNNMLCARVCGVKVKRSLRHEEITSARVTFEQGNQSSDQQGYLSLLCPSEATCTNWRKEGKWEY